MTICLMAGVLAAFGIPFAGLAALQRKYGRTGLVFLTGMAAFFISQFTVRIPILREVLPHYSWYLVMQTFPWANGFFLGATAALVEEGARWIAMKFILRDKRRLADGLAFGLGHGGIEAILLIGVNYILYLYTILSGAGALLPFEPGMVWMAVAERLFAMCFHIGASLLVLYGLKTRRTAIYWGLAFLLHMVLDAGVVILPSVFGVGGLALEVYIGAVGAAVLAAGLYCYLRKETTV